MTISLGVATYPENGKTAEELIEKSLNDVGIYIDAVEYEKEGFWSTPFDGDIVFVYISLDSIML